MGDFDIQNSETLPMKEFWEDSSVQFSSLINKKCWSCGSGQHLKPNCPLRRKGAIGMISATRGRQRSIPRGGNRISSHQNGLQLNETEQQKLQEVMKEVDLGLTIAQLQASKESTSPDY